MTTREQVLQEIAESGYELSAEDQAFVVGLLSTTNWTVRHVVPVIDAIRRGVSPEEFSTISPESVVRLEAQATELYNERNFDDAFSIFAGLFHFARERNADARILRGMAACSHSQGFLLDAIDQYDGALALDPTDVISQVSLAQVLCLAGQRDKGMAIARNVLRDATKSVDRKLIAEAHSLVESKGGQPIPELVRRRGGSVTELLKTTKAREASHLAEEMLAAMHRVEMKIGK